MALVEKKVSVPESVETVVKSAVDLAMALKSGSSLGALVGDIVADIQAVPNLMNDVQENPFETVTSVVLGVISIVKVLVLPSAPVAVEGVPV